MMMVVVRTPHLATDLPLETRVADGGPDALCPVGNEQKRENAPADTHEPQTALDEVVVRNLNGGVVVHAPPPDEQTGAEEDAWQYENGPLELATLRVPVQRRVADWRRAMVVVVMMLAGAARRFGVAHFNTFSMRSIASTTRSRRLNALMRT